MKAKLVAWAARFLHWIGAEALATERGALVVAEEAKARIEAAYQHARLMHSVGCFDRLREALADSGLLTDVWVKDLNVLEADYRKHITEAATAVKEQSNGS